MDCRRRFRRRIAGSRFAGGACGSLRLDVAEIKVVSDFRRQLVAEPARAISKFGSSRDSFHHGSRRNGVNPIISTTSVTSANPRTRPNTMPSNRSLPESPLAFDQLAHQETDDRTCDQHRHEAEHISQQHAHRRRRYAGGKAIRKGRPEHPGDPERERPSTPAPALRR